MKYLNSFSTSLLLLKLAVMPSAALAVEPIIDGTKTVNDVVKGPNALRRMNVFTASRAARSSAALHRRGLRAFGVDGVPLPAARAAVACRWTARTSSWRGSSPTGTRTRTVC